MQTSPKQQSESSWMQEFSQETEEILLNLDPLLKDAFIFFPRAVRSLYQQIAHDNEPNFRSPGEKATQLNLELSLQLPKTTDEALPFLTRYLWERSLGIKFAEEIQKVKSITQNYVQLLNNAGGKIEEEDLYTNLIRIMSVD